ncbi:MAG: mechanosensitive ion channel family protein [Ardenticatenaceae bacterium]|nr:mechanosensitive ion channel family protein [Ardenticatenaceae bacterium]
MSQLLELLSRTNDSFTSIGFPHFLRIFWAVLFFLVGRWLAKRARRLFLSSVENREFHVTRKVILAIDGFIYYGILLIAISISLVTLGLPINSLFTVIILIIVVIAIAMQTTLNNLAATIIFVAFQTFKPGDWVNVLDRTFGQVKEIQLFSTVILTQEQSTVTVPNGDILKSNIVNYSVLGYRRVDMVVTIKYQDDLLKAKQIMEEVLATNEHVLADPKPVVGVLSLGERGVDFSLRPFAPVDAYWDTMFSVTEQVKLRLSEAGVSIPVFQQDVHLIGSDVLSPKNGAQ